MMNAENLEFRKLVLSKPQDYPELHKLIQAQEHFEGDERNGDS